MYLLNLLEQAYYIVMQSGHGGNSQAKGGVEESEHDEKFFYHNQPTILSKEMSAGAMSRAIALARQGRHAQALAPFSYE